MKKITFLFFIIITGFSVSDSRKDLRFLKWNLNGFLYLNNHSKKVLNFEGADYIDPVTCLPYYTESYKISESQEYRIRIANPVFEYFVPDREIQGLEKIGEELNFKSFMVNSAGQRILQFQLLPLVRVGEEFKRLTSFEIITESVPLKKSAVIPFSWKSESVLKSGNWVKIKTPGRGIYRITYDKLKQWGFSDPSNVNLFGNSGFMLSEDNSQIDVDDLKQYKIWTGKDKQGKDCIFFYSPGTTKWTINQQTGNFEHQTNVYSQYAYFYLTDGAGKTLQVETLPPVTQLPAKTVTFFDDYALHEIETYNLIHSGKRWFGERFLPGNIRTISLDVLNRDTNVSVSLVLSAAARSSSKSTIDISSGGNNLGKLYFSEVSTSDPTSLYADEKTLVQSMNPSGNTINLSLLFSSSSNSAEAWLDYAEINFRKKLRIETNELIFRDKNSVGKGAIAEFTVENGLNTRILDITNPADIFEIPVNISGNNLKFIRPAETLKEYIAFNQSENFAEPELAGKIANQNLHGLKDADMVIITHPDFYKSAADLTEFHRTNDGLEVNLVLSDEVFNEFGSGRPDATAIRNFIKMLYSRSQKLKYILLYGDGSFDNRNLGGKNNNFIPTYQSDNSLNPVSSFVTDDYFVILDDGESVYEGAEDLGIGRLPVSTSLEAQTVLDKIKNYQSDKTLGFWRNVIGFIGDDEDGSLHMNDSEQLANLVNLQHNEFLTDKIYLDSYPQKVTPAGERYPEVNAAIDKKIRDGVLILNYIGHANERFMAEEHVLDISDINSWTNFDNLPIFVTATCEFSRFDGDETSAGEYILLNPSGGGIGLFSTTRVVFAYSNFLLNQNFFKFVFNRDNKGERFRMGEIMRQAKIATLNTINKRNFSLLADPALRLSYPKHQVITSSLKKNNLQLGTDTLGALDKVTVSGYITDYNGSKLTGFQGKIIPVVYDKAIRQKTLGNGGEEPYEYKLQDNVIYKGLASVKSGDFSFSFVIPKDISYNTGAGKIVYYAYPDKGTEDANGAYEAFLIGGSSQLQIVDNLGPNVQVFLDDRNFKNGDKTGRNPLLLADISDANGVNTVGSGIGHDITAVLDNDLTNVFVLNAFYRANIDDYKSGVIEFPMKNISIGEHTLKLKVWDVANNSTEVEIRFIVTGDLTIERLTNYPNPVSDFTYFSFTHNQPDATFNLILEIFNRDGKRIDLLKQKVSSSGMTSIPVRWERSRVNAVNGIYIYRVVIQSSDGAVALGSGEMLLIK